jgi:hypothetical protein
MGECMAKKVAKKAKKKTLRPKDYGMQVEIYLRKLIALGDEYKIYGHATSFKNILGDKKCKELAQFLKDSL